MRQQLLACCSGFAMFRFREHCDIFGSGEVFEPPNQFVVVECGVWEVGHVIRAVHWEIRSIVQCRAGGRVPTEYGSQERLRNHRTPVQVPRV